MLNYNTSIEVKIMKMDRQNMRTEVASRRDCRKPAINNMEEE